MFKFPYLFHGTSTVHKPSIQENGLTPRNGAVYLTTHPEVALFEAHNTVDGEHNMRGGYKAAIGGLPLIVLVERTKLVRLKLDVPGYYEHTDEDEGRMSERRFAFKTHEAIAPALISFIEDNCESECRRLLDQINRMTHRPTLGFQIKRRLLTGKICKIWTA